MTQYFVIQYLLNPDNQYSLQSVIVTSENITETIEKVFKYNYKLINIIFIESK